MRWKMASKTFIELDSLMFALCSVCDYDMDCTEEEREDCPVLWAINNSNYIEVDEDMIEMEGK